MSNDFEEFEYDTIEFFVNDDNEFKINKSHILSMCFNEEVQSRWKPKVGDIILGKTGNLFVISSSERLNESIGGTLFFFGGGTYFYNDGTKGTYCYTMNESGTRYNSFKESTDDLYHSSFSEFRWIPRPTDELTRAGLK